MKAILVTGASTGIGYDIAVSLAANYHVFGICRNQIDKEKLEETPNIQGLIADVRDQLQITATFQEVQNSNHNLVGLINNAGVGGLGLYSTWTEKEFTNIFDINVFGVFRFTNTFLPLLLKNNGRVIVIGSQGGVVTKKYFGPYTMTKFALEAYCESLREELEPYGSFVSLIQPGGIVSDIGKNSATEIENRFKRAESPFEEEANNVLKAFKNPQPSQEDNAESESNRKPSPPSIVTDAVREVLESKMPKLRYLVGTNWEGDRVLNSLLYKLIEENDVHTHRYSREKLITMLDSAIEKFNQKY